MRRRPDASEAAGRTRDLDRIPIRILAVIATRDVSGPGRQLAAVATALRERNVIIEIGVLNRGTAEPPYAAFLREADLPVHVIPDGGPADRQLPARVDAVAEQCAADLLQTHSYKATFAAWSVRRAGNARPWVGFYHGHTTESLRARLYHKLDRYMLRRADRVVVMSDAQRAMFRGMGARVNILYNAIVPLPDGSPPLFATSGGEPRIGVIGRLSPEKGVDVLLAACAVLARDSIPFHLVVIGDGPEQERLQAIVERDNLRECVTFAGRLDISRAIYAALDVVVIPSHTEGLPNVLLEAIGCGIPVVSTKVGAVPEVIGSSRAGIIVPTGDPDALAKAIRTMLDRRGDDGMREDQNLLRSRFSLAARADAHVAMYRSLLETGTGASSRMAGSSADVGPEC